MTSLKGTLTSKLAMLATAIALIDFLLSVAAYAGSNM
jgi:hypothetical protein